MPTAGYLPQRAYTALFFKCDGYSNALEVIRFLRQKKKKWNYEEFTVCITYICSNSNKWC